MDSTNGTCIKTLATFETRRNMSARQENAVSQIDVVYNTQARLEFLQ